MMSGLNSFLVYACLRETTSGDLLQVREKLFIADETVVLLD